jgi:hypothetical protein
MPAGDDLPDWMSGLVTESPESQTEELPDWMRGPESAMPESPAAAAEDEGLPDWLRGVDAPISTPTPSAAPAGGADELPDWLRGVDAPISTPTPSAAPAGGADELPDWLRGVDAPISTPPPPAAPVGGADELPDWLRGADAPISTPPPSAVSAGGADELPDWLRGADAPISTPPPPAAPAGGADELPDWLRGADAPISTPPPPAAPAGGDEIPDWLKSGNLFGTEPAPATGGEEFPDWLRDVQPGAGSEKPAAAAAKPVETPAPQAKSSAFSEMPDWLQSDIMPDGEAEQDSGTPDWLRDLEAAGAAQSASSDASTGDAGEIPSWLIGLAPTGVTSGGSKDVFVEPEAGPEKPAPRTPRTVNPADLQKPEKLREVLAQNKPTTASGKAAPAEEVPGWLQELNKSKGTQPAGAAVPDLQQAEVPDWVKSFKPANAASPAPLIDIPDTAASGLERASIPEWIQGMRPTQDSAAQDDGDITLLERAALRRTEDQGPLEGISGVLLSDMLVDMPKDWQPVKNPAPSVMMLEQAKLWKFLLEQPRGAERPVAKVRSRPRWSDAIVRWVMFLVLVAAIVAAFMMPTASADKPAVSWAQQKGVNSLWNKIQTLQSGDLVVVAVEYGAADAEEMNQVAAPLLDHLRGRQARLVTVSSLPEGSAMARMALAMVDIPVITETEALSGTSWLAMDRFPAGSAVDAGYMPGEVNGISWFMGHNEAIPQAKLLIILAARPNRIRWWIEQNANVEAMNQVKSEGAAAWKSLPFGAGMSASAFPQVAPYMDLRGQSFQNAVGWISGMNGAWDYGMKQKTSGGAAPAPTNWETLPLRLNALTYSHWAAAGLLLVGMAYYLIKGRKGAG